MPLKGIFHAPSDHYRELKAAGFTHAEISLNAWPGDYGRMRFAIEQAHADGLLAIIDPGWQNPSAAEDFLEYPGIRDGDVIALPDEANRKFENRGIILPYFLKNYYGHLAKCARPNNRTLATLDGTQKILEYAGCADILAVDWYGRPTDLWRLVPLCLRMRLLKRRHPGELWGIPATKESAGYVRKMRAWFNRAGAKDLYWYSFAGDGGKFGYADLAKERPDLMEELSKC